MRITRTCEAPRGIRRIDLAVWLLSTSWGDIVRITFSYYRRRRQIKTVQREERRESNKMESEILIETPGAAVLGIAESANNKRAENEMI